jgi:basic membrane protein A
MQDAQSSLGANVKYLQSQAATDYAPNINQFVSGGCSLIVTVGFLMGDDTKKAATANPNQKFAIVDFSYQPPLKNVLGLTFSTDQAAFLAGYLAAGMTKSGKVGTFGGQKIPPVTIYMQGFAEGVKYYNQKNGKNVQVLGWNPATQNGVFTGDFTDQDKGKQTANSLMNQGADIVFPVAGSVGLGAAAAVQQAGGNNHMIWVDVDGCVSAPQYCSLFLTSVDKNIATAVTTAMKSVKDGSFKGGLYTGTLQNGGVGLAPYHQFDSKIPASLKSQITQLKQDIISGKVKVSS